MRWERDQVGVSLFVEHGPSFDEVVSATVPPSVLLLFGVIATVCGLAWAGPALLFVGLALWITVPLTLGPAANVPRTVRIDHRGIRIDDQPVRGVQIQTTDRGLLIGDRFLPIRDPDERVDIEGLLQSALDRQLPGEIPSQLRCLQQARG